MDQAKPESEELSRHVHECCEDSALDIPVRVSDPFVPEVSVQARAVVTAYVAGITAKLFRKM
jgi:hypothetical protein